MKSVVINFPGGEKNTLDIPDVGVFDVITTDLTVKLIINPSTETEEGNIYPAGITVTVPGLVCTQADYDETGAAILSFGLDEGSE